MMKKEYIKPEINVVKLTTHGMLATSRVRVYDTEATGDNWDENL